MTKKKNNVVPFKVIYKKAKKLNKDNDLKNLINDLKKSYNYYHNDFLDLED